MRFSTVSSILLAAALLSCRPAQPSATAQDTVEPGFVSLFDGTSLKGWKLVGGAGAGYIVHDRMIICPANGGGNLFTEKEYSDFILKLDFRTDKGGNNGIGIRAPFEGDAAYVGMEVQVLDDAAPQYAKLEPGQYCGSIYKVAAARRGFVKPAGEWNSYEITAVGRRIKIKLNNTLIVDADLNAVTDPKIIAEHPGFLRPSGHIGFLGHGSQVDFRNIRIKDLSKPEVDNTPAPGFTALFNGRDLTGWKGLVADPPKRAAMTTEQLGAAQAQADAQMRDHWRVTAGTLVYDGKGNSLCTVKDYADFEMMVDFKIGPHADSGIYLRGSPQVQIWDPYTKPTHAGSEVGSGGLYNNQKNPSKPSKVADRPIGEWNRLHIVMVGEKVHVFLNGELVVRNVTMENYWERNKPIYPVGQLELQHHGDKLEFKNIYVREIVHSK
jgi:hypothetical protein